MILKKITPTAAVCLPLIVCAQERVLDTVHMDAQLDQARRTQQVYTIARHDIQKNPISLSEILRFQSPVFIKENGRGMVSSPSFRGTTAQQTAMVWNGIIINSIFLGQGDLNNLDILGAETVEVKAGGGSVIYGSSAVGGSVHISSKLPYGKGWSSRFFTEGGSFGTFANNIRTAFSNDKMTFAASASYSGSANDYKVPEKDYISRNAGFHKTGMNLGIGYRLSRSHELYWQSQVFSGMQHFPISSETANRTKYGTYNLRTMLGWNYNSPALKNQLSLAYLEENFDFYQDIDLPKSSGASGKTLVARNDLSYSLMPAVTANLLSEYKNTTGNGYGSGLGHASQNAMSLAFLLKYQGGAKFYAEVGGRKDWVQNVTSPVLLSAGMNYQLTAFYKIKLNGSRNFRNPSFNDLYWQPGGNTDLKPETAWQAEMAHELHFGAFSFSVIPYFISIKNMIRWLPTPYGYWSPVNTNRVRSMGFESVIHYATEIGKNTLRLNGGFTYTDSQNQETKKQLSYVPQYKAFGGAEVLRGRFSGYLQGLASGLTFTTADESRRQALKPYLLLNAGAGYMLPWHLKVGVKAENITGQVYETSAYYPMPGRSWAANMSFDF